MHGVINPSGCHEKNGWLVVRGDLCLDEGDARYNDLRFYQTDWTSREALKGYNGKVDAEGNPLDWEAYNTWVDSLPKIWLSQRVFHSHMMRFNPYTLRDEDITSQLEHHLANFYKAWIDEWDKVPGGMRHGFDVAYRRRNNKALYERFNKTQPELYLQRKSDVLDKLIILKGNVALFSASSTKIGEIFPATEIDVGSAADNRSDRHDIVDGVDVWTLIDLNNAANDSGSIDTVTIYLYKVDGTANLRFGTFYNTSGTDYTCRDAEAVGQPAGRDSQEFTGLDIDVETGDYIGLDVEEGSSGDDWRIDADLSGTELLRYAGSMCYASSSATYGAAGSYDEMSLYGTGETEAEPTAYEESATLTLGLALATVGRDVTFNRAITKPLGLALATVDRDVTFERTITKALGLALSVDRLAEFARAASKAIGLTISATQSYGKGFTATLTLGLALATTGVEVAFNRTFTKALGLALSVDRDLTFERTATKALGLALSVTKIVGKMKSATLTLGLALSASRLVEFARSSSKTLGLAISVDREVGFNRAATVALGLAVSVARLVNYVKTASKSLGMTISVARQVAWQRASTRVIGLSLWVSGGLFLVGNVFRLTLRERITDLTLQARMIDMTLRNRLADLTLDDRKIDLTLRERKDDLTLEDKEVR